MTTVEEAKEKGINIGQLIHSRAVAKDIDLTDVMKMLDRCGDWYRDMIDKIRTEFAQERDDISLGRKVEKTEEEEEQREQLRRIARFMMNLLSTATQEIDKVMKRENQG